MRTRAAVSNMRWIPLRLGARRRPNLAAIHKDDPTSIESHLHGHMVERCVGTRFTPCHEGSYLTTWKDWCFLSELSLLGQLPARADEPVLPRFVQRVFLLKGGTIYNLIHLHSHWELSPLLSVPPLGHIIILMYVLFRLHSRWESSPLPPDQPLGQNTTCVTSSPVAAVGSFLFFRLFHHWVVQKSPSQIQCRGLAAPCNTCRHEKTLHRTCCGEAIHWQGETDTLHRTCCGEAYTDRERLTLYRTCCGEAIHWQRETDTLHRTCCGEAIHWQVETGTT